MKKLFLIAASMFVLVASAATTHRFTIFQPSFINGTELKAGDYRVDVEENKAVISQGKMKVEAAAKMEDAGQKFSSTSIRYSTTDGKMTIAEIRLGGTSKKIVFNN